MFQKALTAKPGIGPSVFSNPLREMARRSQSEPPTVSGLAVSAALSTEEDFELGEDFLDVFTRASERIMGFVVGCTLIGVIWIAFSLI